MSAIIFIVALAMLAMVNAAPVQEDKKNLQGLLDVLADQKTNQESTVQAATMNDDASLQVLQGLLQQDDDGNQADAQFLGKLVKRFLWQANKQQNDDGNQADAQLLGKLFKRFIWQANKQDNQAEAQFLGRLVKRFLWQANKQQDDDGNQADAQFLGKLVKRFFWQANKQQDDDGNQADAQFLGRLVKRFLWQANKQQVDDGSEKADAQFWGFLARTLFKHAAGRGINYAMKKLG